MSIWDDEKAQWISKEDTGTESNTEAEKGLASDSFKRACFNWGIGRELYTAPKIFINLNDGEFTNSGGKVKVTGNTSFTVSEIGYDDKRNINRLVIIDGNGQVRYSLGSEKQVVKQQPKQDTAQAGQDELKEAFEIIADNIKSAPSRAELNNIVQQNKALHGYQPFKDAINKRWGEVA